MSAAGSGTSVAAGHELWLQLDQQLSCSPEAQGAEALGWFSAWDEGEVERRRG
jgi:hypothetical protein